MIKMLHAENNQCLNTRKNIMGGDTEKRQVHQRRTISTSQNGVSNPHGPESAYPMIFINPTYPDPPDQIKD
jgi:hypothetical protein